MSDPTPTAAYGLWGPPDAGRASQDTAVRKPWTARTLGWVLLVVLGTQLVLTPVVGIWAWIRLGQPPIDADSAEAITREIPRTLTTGPGIVAALIVQWVSFLAIPWWATKRKGNQSIRLDLGWQFARADIGAGLLFAVGLQGLLIATHAAVLALGVDLSGADNTGQVTDHEGFVLVLLIVGACVGAPVVEELLFRGFMLRALLRSWARIDHAPPIAGVSDHYRTASDGSRRTRLGVGASILTTAIVFGMLHTPVSTEGPSPSVAAVLALMGQTGLLGLAFGVIAYRMRRIGRTVLTHAWFNTISLALVLLSR